MWDKVRGNGGWKVRMKDGEFGWREGQDGKYDKSEYSGGGEEYSILESLLHTTYQTFCQSVWTIASEVLH